MRKIREHVLLSELSTMRVGGPARYFYAAKNTEDVKEAAVFAERQKLPLFILGGGSNIVVSDEGFPGVVVRPDIGGIHFEEKGDAVFATVGAGEEWDAFVEETVLRGLYALENLSGIPGTVGGAPIQNVGAYGVEVKEFIRSVEVFNLKSKETVSLSPDACAFSYRDSFFKSEAGRDFIITRVIFALPKRGIPRLEYRDVAEHVKEHNLSEKNLNPAHIRNIILSIRGRKLPDVKKVGTVGSFFKNPIVSKEKFTALSHIYRGMPGFPLSDGRVKIPLGWIIDIVCKKKGVREGNVGVYEKQALALVHFGGGTAKEIREFAEGIRDDIRRHTGIEAEFEISFIGEF